MSTKRAKMLDTTLGMIDRDLAAKTWAMGDRFTLADCAAAPALFYINKMMPLADTLYACRMPISQRLMQRPVLCPGTERGRALFEVLSRG